MGHMFIFRMTGIDYRIVFQYQQMIHTSKLVPSEVKYAFKCTALCSFEELNKTWLGMYKVHLLFTSYDIVYFI